MHLRDIIRASKDNIKIGTWRSGKVPRAEFPMARSAYALGTSYRWCVISFEAAGAECLVLIVLNESKQKYQAVLGVRALNGLRILCTYEYHPDEPGWHCHATHDDVSTLTQTYMRGPWIKRVPGARKPHRPKKYPAFRIGDQEAAIRFALARYKIEKKGPLL